MRKTEDSARAAVFVWFALLLAGGLLTYSQTKAFSWDEGFHLLAAQLIAAGRQPYLDFCFAQTPLNAYWNAASIRLFGASWHAAHALAALLTTGAIVLAADFLRTRFRVPAWGASSLVLVLFLAGCNVAVVEYGTVAQAYGFCLLLIVAAFRATVLAVERASALLAALAGFLAAAAAEASLLTAAVGPVLLLWMLYYSPERRRVVAGMFLGGAAIALLPLAVLFAKSPARVLFDVFEYHLFYRRSDWPGATRHDLEVLASWIDFPQAIILGALAAAGLWFIAKKSGWERLRRGEFYLCAWLASALALHISTAHPTFARYYLFTTPFLAILASVGLFAAASRMGIHRALWPAAAVCVLMLLGAAKRVYDRDDLTWRDLENVARKVDEVTPAGAPLYADEQVYFLTRRTPPSGNEYLSSHKLRLPPDQAALVHIVPQPEFDRRISEGMFSTLETCEEEDWIAQRNLTAVYRQKAAISDSGCTVFWDRVQPIKENAARLP